MPTEIGSEIIGTDHKFSAQSVLPSKTDQIPSGYIKVRNIGIEVLVPDIENFQWGYKIEIRNINNIFRLICKWNVIVMYVVQMTEKHIKYIKCI